MATLRRFCPGTQTHRHKQKHRAFAGASLATLSGGSGHDRSLKRRRPLQDADSVQPSKATRQSRYVCRSRRIASQPLFGTSFTACRKSQRPVSGRYPRAEMALVLPDLLDRYAIKCPSREKVRPEVRAVLTTSMKERFVATIDSFRCHPAAIFRFDLRHHSAGDTLSASVRENAPTIGGQLLSLIKHLLQAATKEK